MLRFSSQDDDVYAFTGELYVPSTAPPPAPSAPDTCSASWSRFPPAPPGASEKNGEGFVVNPSFESGSGWLGLSSSSAEVQAAPHGTSYAEVSSNTAISQETGQRIAVGKYTLESWARSTNALGNTAAALAELRLTAGGTELASITVDVGVKALEGAAATQGNDDGANVWIDGGNRVSFADTIMYQPLASDPIADAWQSMSMQNDVQDFMAWGQIILPSGERTACNSATLEMGRMFRSF